MGARIHRAVVRGVEKLYENAHSRLSSPPGPGTLAIALLGPSGLAYDRSVRARDWSLAKRVDGGWRILVSPGLSDPDTSMAVSMGLCEWGVGQSIFPGHLDAWALDAAASNVVLPLPALSMAVWADGLTVEQVAAKYVCPMHVVIAQLAFVEPVRHSGFYRRLLSVG